MKSFNFLLTLFIYLFGQLDKNNTDSNNHAEYWIQ